MNRNLDGCYFRVKRDGHWESICFSDLTDEEQREVTKDRDAVWLRNLCFHLAYCIKEIGDSLDIRGE